MQQRGLGGKHAQAVHNAAGARREVGGAIVLEHRLLPLREPASTVDRAVVSERDASVNGMFQGHQIGEQPSTGAPLGIVAGGGRLPGDVAAAAVDHGRPVFVLALRGFAEPAVVERFPHEYVRIGAVGKMLRAMRSHGVSDLVMVGAVRRPALRELRPDFECMRAVVRMGRVFFAGDDALLSAVVRAIGEHGFRVVAVQDVLADALAPAGVLTRAAPDADDWNDIARAEAVAAALGAADVGQGCVVQQGLVLAVEAIEGTDAMLARAGSLARSGRGGVLVKLVKPGQERRVDLPTIGPRTVANAAAAGLRGIAFSAGAALLADPTRTVADADAAGLFLVGLDAPMVSAKPEETA